MKKNQILVIGLVGESVFMTCDHFHQDGETIIIDSIYKEPGGKGYNQAVACQKQEANTVFIGSVGNDEFGQKSIEYLDKLNVKHHFIINNNISSAYATILTNRAGDNQVSVYPGASCKLKVSDLEKLENMFKESSYLLIQLELSNDVILKSIELAKKYHVKIVLNPAPYKKIVHDILDDCDIITPNFHEAKQIFGLDLNSNIEDLKKKMIFSKNCMVVTLGKNGALVYENDIFTHIESSLKDQSKVVDTTGAGDIFNGVMVAYLSKGYSLVNSTYYGVKASSYSVQKKYVMPSIPSIGELND